MNGTVKLLADRAPTVLIRLLDALTIILEETPHPEQQQVLLNQAEMILTVTDASVAEPADRADVHRRYDALLANVT